MTTFFSQLHILERVKMKEQIDACLDTYGTMDIRDLAAEINQTLDITTQCIEAYNTYVVKHTDIHNDPVSYVCRLGQFLSLNKGGFS